jgi:hypothetical protein
MWVCNTCLLEKYTSGIFYGHRDCSRHLTVCFLCSNMLHSAQLFTVLNDAQAVTEGSQMPETVPEAVKDKIFPPEQLSLTAFIDFCLPPCSTSRSELENYFTTLPPDAGTSLVPADTDALRTLSLPPPSVVHQLSLRAATAWTNGSRSGYIRTAFLRSCPNLNPLAITVKIPLLAPSEQVSKSLDYDRWMQSPTFLRILKYLKHVLETEWRSQQNPILIGMSAQDVRSAFVRQFERYVKGVYPFETPIGERQSPLAYWRNLTLNNDSAVLAVRSLFIIHLKVLSVITKLRQCIGDKLFSIKPNSMPEERTMSVFTKMNSASCNRQQVRTLVDMTQIRQWHTYDPTVGHNNTFLLR